MQQASVDQIDQSEIVALLGRPQTHGGRGPVERIDTHISHLFLVGDRAYKLKRAVRFPDLDFSTAARRRRCCEAEVAVNRRTAPDLYIGVAPVLRDGAGDLKLGQAGAADSGAAVDWVVVMRRFDQDALFDAMAQQGGLDTALITELADVIAAFHEAARRTPGFGGADGMRRVIDGNHTEIARFVPRLFPADAAARLDAAIEQAFRNIAPLLDARRAAGMVRHGHGDLHLRNICLIDGRPTPFDAIEFNDDIANIDVFHDFAFLLMDLEHRGQRNLANEALNHYLPREGDYGGLAALPLFLACRAAVRAHVTAMQAPADAPAAEARSYLDLALRLVQPAPPRLVAIGGLSGAGKSHLARDLAPGFGAPLGAIVLRSDVIRKRLLGVDPLTRLGPEAYRADVTRRVFDTIRAQAAIALEAGCSVIADAVYGRPRQRAAIEETAWRRGAAFDGLWLQAPIEVRISRIQARTADASDATARIAREQSDYRVGEPGWHRIDAAGEPAATLAHGRKTLNLSAKRPTL